MKCVIALALTAFVFLADKASSFDFDLNKTPEENERFRTRPKPVATSVPSTVDPSSEFFDRRKLPKSEETRERISQARKGHLPSKTHLDNLSKAQRRRFANEDQATRNLRAQRLSKALKGRKFDHKRRANMSKAQLGKVFTDEHKANLSAGRRRYIEGMMAQKRLQNRQQQQ